MKLKKLFKPERKLTEGEKDALKAVGTIAGAALVVGCGMAAEERVDFLKKALPTPSPAEPTETVPQSKEPEKETKSPAISWRLRLMAIVMSVLLLVIPLVGLITSSIPVTGIVSLEQAAADGTLEKVTVNAKKKSVIYTLKDNDNTYIAFYSDEYVLMDTLSSSGAKVYRNTFQITDLLWGMFGIGIVWSVVLLVTMLSRVKLPSRIQESVCEQSVRSKTRFEDIIGLDEIKDRLRLLVKLCRNHRHLPKGIKIPRGILFEGDPGNGKTMLAGAFANECGMSFIAVNSSDLMTPLVGGSEKLVRQLFAKAKAQSPCVLFLDEFDAVGSARNNEASSSAGKGYNSLVDALLTQLDGIGDSGNIIVIAATNNAAGLDRALVRPGRFDMRLVIPYPDKTAREGLFRLYLKEAKVEENVSMGMLVSVTEGCSSAAVRNICNEARLSAFERDSETVSKEDFNAALLAVNTKGFRKKERESDEFRHIAAIHEAGHAIAANYHSRKKVLRISICGTTSGIGGYTESVYGSANEVRTLQDIRNELVIMYGGMIAEQELSGEPLGCSLGASSDIRQATSLCLEYVNAVDGIDYSAFRHGESMLMERVQKTLREIQEETRACIREHWDALLAIAGELEEKDTITFECEDTYNTNMPVAVDDAVPAAV